VDSLVREKKTNNAWFETQDSISYWEDFSQQKIVWGNLNLTASYSLAGNDIFVNAPCPMIVPASKYLLAILNSKAADYYIRRLGVTRNGGYFEYKPMFIEKLPVPELSVEQQQLFAILTDDPTQENQNVIDKMVYDLYSLSLEEIAFIEGTSS